MKAAVIGNYSCENLAATFRNASINLKKFVPEACLCNMTKSDEASGLRAKHTSELTEKICLTGRLKRNPKRDRSRQPETEADMNGDSTHWEAALLARCVVVKYKCPV
jgi:hypothetical protein